MKILLLFAASLLLVFSASAAAPDYKAFRGTGGITVTSNPPNGTIVFDGSGVTAGSASVTNLTTTNSFRFGLYAQTAGGVIQFYGIEQGTNAVLYFNGSNVVFNAASAASSGPASDALLLQSGDYLLLNDGGFLLF